MSRFGVFKINGVEFDLDDLDLDEVEAIEELSGGVPFSEMNFGSSKTMKAIAFTLLRRNDPALELSAVGKVKLIDFAPPDEEMPETGPPAEGVPNPNGSEHADSGAPASAASIRG